MSGEQGFAKLKSSRSGETVAPIGSSGPGAPSPAPTPTTYIHQVVLRYATFNSKTTSNDAAQWILAQIPEDERARIKIVESYAVKEVMKTHREVEVAAYKEESGGLDRVTLVMEGERVERLKSEPTTKSADNVSPHSDTKANQ